LNESLSKTTNTKFIFGIDEYFINDILIDNMMKNKIPIAIRYSYHILGPFFMAKTYIGDLSKNEKELLTKSMDFILGKKMNDSLENKLDILDKHIYYVNKNTDITPIVINIVNRIYKLYELYKKNKIFFGFFTNDYINLALNNRGIIHKDIIAIYNIPNISEEIIIDIIQLHKNDTN